MHAPSRIQPIDIVCKNGSTCYDFPKPGAKTRLRRLFGQFPNLSRTPSIEKTALNGPAELEPNSVCLAKMVRNFVEENDKPSPGKNRCNCFNGSFSDSSDDELSIGGGDDGCEILKNLVSCASVCERNLLVNTSKIVEKNKIDERKVVNLGEIVRDGLVDIGYDAAICKSHWEKSAYYPAGEYEYVDVIVDGLRLIVDIDFRSQFEIARSTNSYKAILQILPTIFVGKSDRLMKVITVVSEAAKQSLKKMGMPFPPWRKAAYIQSKWLSDYTRIYNSHVSDEKAEAKKALVYDKVLKKSASVSEANDDDCVFTLSCSSEDDTEVKVPKSSLLGVKVVSGFVPVISGNQP